MTIAWTADMNTGIDVIDDQHRRIVDYVNLLERANRHHTGTVVGQVLTDLVDYTTSHFAFEEKLQTDAGYKFAQPHKSVHDLFIKRVAKYRQRYDAGEDVGEQLHDMLKTWLIHHIKRDDADYVAAVNSKIAVLVHDKAEGGWLSRTLRTFFDAPDAGR